MLPFVAIGTLGAIGHLALILALRFALASLVSPFLYSQLLWAALSGYLFFHELPTLNTLAGALMVIGSGLLLMFWGRQSSRQSKNN
jgi:drug/metabolite transporter (DMT)-like permease